MFQVFLTGHDNDIENFKALCFTSMSAAATVVTTVTLVACHDASSCQSWLCASCTRFYADNTTKQHTLHALYPYGYISTCSESIFLLNGGCVLMVTMLPVKQKKKRDSIPGFSFLWSLHTNSETYAASFRESTTDNQELKRPRTEAGSLGPHKTNNDNEKIHTCASLMRIHIVQSDNFKLGSFLLMCKQLPNIWRVADFSPSGSSSPERYWR
jgi:hypothetical protein